MSVRNNKDWDLCWHYLSSTGCKNSDCTWRHGNSVSDFNKNNVHKTPGKGVSPRGTTFYPIKQHQDGGVEDQHGLVHYPEMDKRVGSQKSIESQSKPEYSQESEDIRPFPSPMSESSSGKTSASASLYTSMLTSQDASDSEGDMVKNDVVVSTRDFGKFQKRNSYVLPEVLYGEVKTPRAQVKKEWLSGKKKKSCFSPFAKVFVPRKSVMSKDKIIAGSNKMTFGNFAVDAFLQRGTQKSCLTENDKVFE